MVPSTQATTSPISAVPRPTRGPIPSSRRTDASAQLKLPDHPRGASTPRRARQLSRHGSNTIGQRTLGRLSWMKPRGNMTRLARKRAYTANAPAAQRRLRNIRDRCGDVTGQIAGNKREQKINEEMHGSVRRGRPQIEWRGLCVNRTPYETTNSSDLLDPNPSMDGRNLRRFSRCSHAFRRRPEG
jgi:hypothetical protein